MLPASGRQPRDLVEPGDWPAYYGAKDIPKGTLAKILRDRDLTLADLLK
jgi:hypothetical protein